MRNTHFILDEAASLGHLEAIDDAVDKYRGYGVRLQFYFQSLGQVKKCFPESQDQTLLSNTTQIFFGVNDNATADYVSTRLSESTIVVESGGRSSGRTSGSSQGLHSQTNDGSSYNSNSNWQQQTRRLAKSEEVMAMSPRTAIAFPPNMPPVRTNLLRYYEEKRIAGRPGWLTRARLACATLFVATVFLAFMATLAIVLTHELNLQSQSSIAPTPSAPASKTTTRHSRPLRRTNR